MRVSEIGNFQKMQSAANEVEMATTRAAGSPPRQAATHVVVDQPTFRLGSFVWESSLGVLGALGQAAMVTFLVFFLLLGGDTFKRKLVRLTGPTLSRRKITVQILDDINASIQKYMLMLLTTNLLVAVSCWAAFHWIGLENAGAWAGAAGLLHLIPYLGPGVTAVATGMAAFVQFDSFGMALLVAAASLGIATVVGTFVTTWMTGRIANMNSAAVFISLLFWGWLVGHLGHAPEHSHHRHHQGDLRARGSAATGRRTARRLTRACADHAAAHARAANRPTAVASPPPW
jgi:predicted PurR-regulated permease PerM